MKRDFFIAGIWSQCCELIFAEPIGAFCHQTLAA
jgi:hypothetical protein